jgi:hypothetical protein
MIVKMMRWPPHPPPVKKQALILFVDCGKITVSYKTGLLDAA